MREQSDYENKYCGSCKRTTKHEVRESGKAFRCARCGSMKRHSSKSPTQQLPWWRQFFWL